jgi:hypothetical protein
VIGEPEMVGESGGPPDDVLGDSDASSRPNGGWSGRRWVWAAGGAAVASAMWAAVLHGTGGGAPDLHGYHVGGNPCVGGTLGALEKAMGGRSFAVSEATVSQGTALEKVSCLVSGTAPAGGGWVTDYTVSVDVELHRTTDPRAEFENARGNRVSRVPGSPQDGSTLLVVSDSGDPAGTDVHPVTGVGDEAYFVESRGGGQRLVVLHGGAVLTLAVRDASRWNGPTGDPADPAGARDAPDLARLQPAMTVAMRRLMAALAS